MNKIRLLALVVTVLALSSQVFAAGAQPTFAGAEKMGFGLQRTWTAAMDSGEMDTEIGVMVSLNSGVTGKTLRAVKEAGLKVNVTLITVITGKINIGDIANLVALDSVKSVDTGKKIELK